MSNGAVGDAAPPEARPIAKGVLNGGRATLLLTMAAVILCRTSRSTWIGAPQDGGVPNHWITITTLVIAFLAALTLPALVLPVGSWALTTNDGTSLKVRTVLGTRRVSLASARANCLTLPGRGTDTELVILRDAAHRTAIVARSSAWGDRRELDDWLVRGVSAPTSRLRKALRYALGFGVMLVCAFCSFLVLAALMAAAGL